MAIRVDLLGQSQEKGELQPSAHRWAIRPYSRTREGDFWLMSGTSDSNMECREERIPSLNSRFVEGSRASSGASSIDIR